MKKLAMLLLVLALCLPSYGDILVYKVSIAGKVIGNTGEDAIFSNQNLKGYMVIDIDTTDPDNEADESALIVYGKVDGEKVQINLGDLLDYYYMDAMAKADTYAVFAGLYSSIDGGGDLVDVSAVLIGKATLTNIGFEDQRIVAKSLAGNFLLWSDPFGDLDLSIEGSGKIKADLQSNWTKAYNAGEVDFADAVADIQEVKLADYEDITGP